MYKKVIVAYNESGEATRALALAIDLSKILVFSVTIGRNSL
jgi:hypothetical protein